MDAASGLDNDHAATMRAEYTDRHRMVGTVRHVSGLPHQHNDNNRMAMKIRHHGGPSAFILCDV